MLDGYIYLYQNGAYQAYALNSDYAIAPYTAFFVKASEKTVIKMTGMDRFNFRSLVSTKTLKDHLTVSLGFNSMYGKHFGVPTGNEGASVLDAMNYYSPTNAIKDAQGNWTLGLWAQRKRYKPSNRAENRGSCAFFRYRHRYDQRNGHR